MRIFVFCVFFVEYSSDCRDKYKYLKPLLAKWSRYYFTSLGGVLTGGHTISMPYGDQDPPSMRKDTKSI